MDAIDCGPWISSCNMSQVELMRVLKQKRHKPHNMWKCSKFFFVPKVMKHGTNQRVPFKTFKACISWAVKNAQTGARKDQFKRVNSHLTQMDERLEEPHFDHFSSQSSSDIVFGGRNPATTWDVDTSTFRKPTGGLFETPNGRRCGRQICPRQHCLAECMNLQAQ